MALSGQRIQPDRFALIPRTLIFLLRGDQVLLMRLHESRGAWGGKYNGVGGHIEAGEDPLTAALRETAEETGLAPAALRLAGVIVVYPGSSPGIGLYVYVGEVAGGEAIAAQEGTPEWVSLDEIEEKPLVEDLLMILPRAVACYNQKETFSAITTFDDDGFPIVHFTS